jgi:hypothetical protein
MSLQFIGDYGIFLPGRDAVGCAALDRNPAGALVHDPLRRWRSSGDGVHSATTMDLVDRFERNRRILEKAADIKYSQRAKIERDGSIRIELADLDSVTGR